MFDHRASQWPRPHGSSRRGANRAQSGHGRRQATGHGCAAMTAGVCVIASAVCASHVLSAARALVPQVDPPVRANARSAGGGAAAAVVHAPAPKATTAASAGFATPVASGGVDCARLRCIALTFDDGPGPLTPTVLTELDAAGVKATFFEIGERVQKYPQITKMLVEHGMVVGNHTWNHPQLPYLSRKGQQRQIDAAREAIVAAGAPSPTLLRPPYGTYDSVTRQLGQAIVLWDVDSQDWKNHSVSRTTQNVLREARSGSIVLMHDIQPSTVSAVPGIIDALKARGFTFVTVPQLLGSARPAVTGSVTFNRSQRH